MSSQSNQMQVGQPTRSAERSSALDRAIRKRANGVPTYTVPEAAALLSISQEYLYRLIQAEAFPAVRMGLGGRHGRYVIAAKAVEQLLDGAAGDNAVSTTAKGANVSGGLR
ncbi:helix-turn-helix domain-containing protein [Pseudonocardia sp.]|uniref:helix-turn-helix domain-containing protein n=1 Tax=Pseudonocardia sp. TaxID=60912 RepID=UPI003D0F6659